MRTLAVVPIKTLSSAKQRLSGALATGARASLAQAMFSDVLASLRRSQQVEAIAVVTADVVANAVAHGERVTVLPDDRQDGQSTAALIGIRYAAAAGFERAVLVPGDTPLLDAVELDEMLVRCEADPVAVGVVPDRHGTGTNGLLLSPPDAIHPSFGPDSCERHLRLAADAGVAGSVADIPSMGLDLDTGEDLAELRARLSDDGAAAPRTAAALDDIGARTVG